MILIILILILILIVIIPPTGRAISDGVDAFVDFVERDPGVRSRRQSLTLTLTLTPGVRSRRQSLVAAEAAAEAAQNAAATLVFDAAAALESQTKEEKKAAGGKEETKEEENVNVRKEEENASELLAALDEMATPELKAAGSGEDARIPTIDGGVLSISDERLSLVDPVDDAVERVLSTEEHPLLEPLIIEPHIEPHIEPGVDVEQPAGVLESLLEPIKEPKEPIKEPKEPMEAAIVVVDGMEEQIVPYVDKAQIVKDIVKEEQIMPYVARVSTEGIPDFTMRKMSEEVEPSLDLEIRPW